MIGAGAAAAIDPHLPRPVDHVLLQADLTAVAPGPLETEVARRLHLLADVESRGGATVYRDVTHLTVTYAKTLSPFVLRELEKIGALPAR